MTVADPFITFHFNVTISAIGDIGYFTEVGGLEMKINAAESRSVTKDGRTVLRKVPTDSVDYSDIVLKRAVTSNLKLWEWRKLIEEGKVDSARCDGTIEMVSMAGEVVAAWNFSRGWPSKITGPSLSAESDSVSIEELTISHEGLTREV